MVPTSRSSAPPGYEEAVLPHLDAAYRLALWLVRDPTLARDVVQDAALRALGYFGSFRGGDGRSWLLRIVRNAGYEALAARGRHVAACLEAAAAVIDPADGPEAALAHVQAHGVLQRAIGGLPLELRECLVLREIEELSYKQIAAVTGVPVGTVMSRLWRARQALVSAGAGA